MLTIEIRVASASNFGQKIVNFILARWGCHFGHFAQILSRYKREQFNFNPEMKQ